MPKSDLIQRRLQKLDESLGNPIVVDSYADGEHSQKGAKIGEWKTDKTS